MNIFYLDHNQIECAKMHNDKHCIKMILEYAQLLSTAHRVLDGKEIVVKSKTGRNVKRWVLDDPKLDALFYSATHTNHPSAVWARRSLENYNWLAGMLAALCTEYSHRYGKTHKCQQINLVATLLVVAPKNFRATGFTEPTPAMPEDVKVAGNSIASYRNYYIKNKQHLASWKGKVNSRKIPEWFHANV